MMTAVVEFSSVLGEIQKLFTSFDVQKYFSVYAYFISVFEANFEAKSLNKILKKKNSFFQNRHSNQHLTNIFRMCSFDSE